MIGKWVMVDGKEVQVVMREPTHPEGKIWTTITEDNQVFNYSDNDLNKALYDSSFPRSSKNTNNNDRAFNKTL